MMQPIGNSELIITSRGTIYHLDLAPGQLADTIITVGDPDRVEIVSKYFDRIEYKARHREFVTHTGYIGSKRLSVVSTGIGPDNIDIVLNELDALVNIDFDSRTVVAEPKSLSIIRFGTSGSLHADIAVDSFVVSSHGIGLDNMLHYYQYENTEDEHSLLRSFIDHTGLAQSPIVPYIAAGSVSLAEYFKDGYTHGMTGTCPGFYGPQGRILRGRTAYPDLMDKIAAFDDGGHRVINMEMETSAIYGLGKLLGHECLSINTMVNNRVWRTFSKDTATSIDLMIRTSLGIIEKI